MLTFPKSVTPLKGLKTSTPSASSLQRQNGRLQIGYQTPASCKIAIVLQPSVPMPELRG